MTGPKFNLSISVVVYRSDHDLLRDVLAALSAAVRQALSKNVIGTCRTWLIDNGNEGDFLEKLSASAGLADLNSLVLHNDANIGFGRAHNIALCETTSDCHLILNPDAVLEETALVEGLMHLDHNPRTVMVCPFAEDQNGERAYLCKRYPSWLTLFARGFLPQWARPVERLARYECQDYPDDIATHNVEIVSGCCMLGRTCALKQVGGFNEAYFLYFEDFELSLALGQNGSIDYVPSMRIVHHGGKASSKGLGHIGMFGRSALRFFRNNDWRWM
jgi:GT2 family glycosyltransferase